MNPCLQTHEPSPSATATAWPHRPARQAAPLGPARWALARWPAWRAIVVPMALASGAVATQAQGLPAAPASLVQLQLTSCGTTLLRGQGALSESCNFNLAPGLQGNSAASGSNLGGILRASTTSSVAQVNLIAATTSSWDDRWTFLGGTVPASAVFSFQLAGTLNAAASGRSTAAINEVGYRAFLRPFGSWGTSASFASGTLSSRQVLESIGPAVSEFRPVLDGLTLPVALSGIAIGDSLDLSSTLTLQSQASAARDGLANASGNFSNSAGLVDLRFFDALGADITPQVHYSWQWGTQFLAPVPEAGTLWLALGGLAGLLAWRRKA